MKLRSSYLGIILLLPALAVMLAFVVFPTIWGVVMSMTNASLVGIGAAHPRFIGLNNYISLLRDSRFYHSLSVTVIFTVFSALIGQVALGLALALLMRRKDIKGKSVIATAVFISWVIPEVVAGYMWGSYASREGLLNLIIKALRLDRLGIEPTNWLFYKPLETITIANVWRGTAFSMILFSAALESIPNFLYEASSLDGASSWDRFRYITLPLLAPAILTDLILITIWTFSVFTMPFIMTGGGPGTRSELWTIYIYRQALLPPYEIGYAAAAATLMFLFTLVLIVAYITVLKRGWG
ncbi:MAG: ABC transporter permease [Thermofilum sp. ex4484_15]|nr:MAG: ABC transporter permease [Thermofilum sp. ex4484_15]